MFGLLEKKTHKQTWPILLLLFYVMVSSLNYFIYTLFALEVQG
jgi:hypothetical protein